jgi:hypothetical protein
MNWEMKWQYNINSNESSPYLLILTRRLGYISKEKFHKF